MNGPAVTGLLGFATAAALLLSACGSETAAPAACETAAPSGATALAIEGTNDLVFEPDRLVAPAGAVHVTLTNIGQVPHTFVIEDLDGKLSTRSEGDTCGGTWDLPVGEYEFWCDVPGHREAGMEGVLTVT